MKMAYDQHYLTYFDDSALADQVQESKEYGFPPRKFVEMFYIPDILVGDAEVFLHCLCDQAGDFVYDIFRRGYELYGGEFSFAKEDFSVEEYSCSEDLQLMAITLPKTEVEVGSFLRIILVLDPKHEEVYFATVEWGDSGRNWLYTFDVYTHEWTDRGVAPEDTEALLWRVLEITMGMSRYQYIRGKCPLCGQVFQLGLTDEEMDGYRRFRADEIGLEDALPKLNAFEREFLMTGMCPDCQCAVFRKELPTDISRWALG
jgi:hypothetical protein